MAGTDPEFAAKQLLIEAGVSIAMLEPMCDAQLPEAEHVLKSTHNDWLADVWLDHNNSARTVARLDQCQRPGTLSCPHGKSNAGPDTPTWLRC